MIDGYDPKPARVTVRSYSMKGKAMNEGQVNAADDLEFLRAHGFGDAADRIEALEAENRRAWAVANQKMERNHKRGEAIEALEREKAELAAEVERLRDIVARVPSALNDQFAAGMEEREGGSARRQESYLMSGHALRRDIAALAPNPEQDR